MEYGLVNFLEGRDMRLDFDGSPKHDANTGNFKGVFLPLLIAREKVRISSIGAGLQSPSVYS